MMRMPLGRLKNRTDETLKLILPAMPKLVSLCNGFSVGILLFALFLSAVEKTGLYIPVSMNCIRLMGLFHFVLSTIVLYYSASKTIFSCSLFLSIFSGY